MSPDLKINDVNDKIWWSFTSKINNIVSFLQKIVHNKLVLSTSNSQNYLLQCCYVLRCHIVITYCELWTIKNCHIFPFLSVPYGSSKVRHMSTKEYVQFYLLLLMMRLHFSICSVIGLISLHSHKLWLMEINGEHSLQVTCGLWAGTNSKQIICISAPCKLLESFIELA